MSKLEDLQRLINEKVDAVKGVWDEVDTKFNGEIDESRTVHVIALNKEIEELEKRAVDEKHIVELRRDSETRVRNSFTPSALPTQPGASKASIATLGDKFVNSTDWVNYFKTLAPNGQVGERTRVQSPTLLLQTGIKAILTGGSDTSGGAFLPPDDSGIYETLGRRVLTIRDIISVRTTQSDLIEYVQMTSHTNAAAMVAEATASAGASGVKPEGDMAFLRVSTAVKTIAEWVAATKRSLSDAGQLRGIIDQELRADLEETLEDQILNGNGVGENFAGLDTIAGTQDQAWDTDVLTTTRKARTKVSLTGRALPTAYVMNPLDWETIDLLQDNEARYFFGGPSQMGTPRLWGLPVVESEAQAAGNAWVGDWRKIVLWDREQAQISISDAHADFFIRNLVAILAELRAAMGVIRPSAFVEIDLTA